MLTIILPGYSSHNKEWAKEVKDSLRLGRKTIVHKWRHWQGGSMSVNYEINKIMEEIGAENVNIIAKSVGTRVGMHLIPQIINKVNKVILCGIPTKGESESTKTLYKEGLALLGVKSVICFQNTSDPFASFLIIQQFVHAINPEIKVIEKSRNDHEYPYFDDFNLFLKG